MKGTSSVTFCGEIFPMLGILTQVKLYDQYKGHTRTFNMYICIPTGPVPTTGDIAQW